MGKLICLMGASSSGKDTIFKQLLNSNVLQFEKFVPYTTRPMRDGETEGVEYHFVTELKYQHFLINGLVIEARCYDTVHGMWRYFTVANKEICFNDKSYLLITTPQAYKKICNFYDTIPVYITLDNGERLSRALHREQMQNEPKYEELCRRFLADAKDFSEGNLLDAGITYECTFYNNDLEQCVSKIMDYLKQNV